MFYIIEFVTSCADQWENWFARDTLTVVSLTRAEGGASNIASWYPVLIALLRYINVVIGKFIPLLWYYCINKWIKEWYIKEEKKKSTRKK